MTSVDGYLFDTSALSIYWDPTHQLHDDKIQALSALHTGSAHYVSVVALAELQFGIELALRIGKSDSPSLRTMISRARGYASLDLTKHTAEVYAKLKSKLAAKYLANPLRRGRRDGRLKYVEDWIDKATGKALGVDENDLWMCAQAKERELILVTADSKMRRIKDADPDVRLLIF